jgi:hypothetical protein
MNKFKPFYNKIFEVLRSRCYVFLLSIEIVSDDNRKLKLHPNFRSRIQHSNFWNHTTIVATQTSKFRSNCKESIFHIYIMILQRHLFHIYTYNHSSYCWLYLNYKIEIKYKMNFIIKSCTCRWISISVSYNK